MAKSKDNIKEIAQILFLQNKLSQKEIAEKLEVSQQTVTRWAKAGTWDSCARTCSLPRAAAFPNSTTNSKSSTV